MTIAANRTAIADAITDGCTGWRTLDYVPDQISPPMIIVDFEVGPQLAFGPGATSIHNYTLVIQAFVQRDSERAGQLKLDTLRDPADSTSLWQILQASTVGDFVNLTSASAVQSVSVAMVEYLMTEFRGTIGV